MSAPDRTQEPPPPGGAGAGGGGRAEGNANSATASFSARPPSGSHALATSPARGEESRRDWGPDFGQTRQREFARTNERAKRQRKEMTPSEKRLWKLLRAIDGTHFRKQPAVDQYVFDFGDYSARLLIEIDGSIHRLPDVQANDRAKEIYAVTHGFRVLRFANNDVWDRPAWVVSQVRALLSAPHPQPPPRKGEGA